MIKHILGIFLISVPLILMTISLIVTLGWLPTILVWLGTIAIIGCVMLGVELMI